MSRFNVYNKETIKNFYKGINYTHFLGLTNERQQELEAIVEKWRHFFEDELYTLGSKMTFTSERLITSAKNFDLHNGDEKIYFYTRMVDPNFLFLEAYENANTRDEFYRLCMNNFGLVDSIIPRIETEINRRFPMVDLNDLLERNAIKKPGQRR